MKHDPPFTTPVGNIQPHEQAEKLRAALKGVQQQFPGLGITLFVFDYGPRGGLLYGSTAQRDDMLRAIDDWRAKIRSQRN